MINKSATYNAVEEMLHGSLNNIMATRFDAVIVGKEENAVYKLWERIKEELYRIEKLLNRFDAESEVTKINLLASYNPVTINDELWDIIIKCKKYFIKTEKKFDITLKDFSKVILDEKVRTISFASKDIFLDFGGIGKGYALSKIENILKKENVQSALLCFGNSSIYAVGSHPYGDGWQIEVENPFVKNKIVNKVNIKNRAMSTSGNTPAHMGHIVDTITGQPAADRKLVSVVADDSIEAEVLSTAYMIADNATAERIARNFAQHETFIFNV